MRRVLALALICALLVPLGACWDNLRVGEMLIACGLSLDREGDGFRAGVELLQMGQSDGGTGALLLEGTGLTFGEAFSAVMQQTAGVLYMEHCRVIILGEELAREGIAELVRQLLRRYKFQPSAALCIARDGTGLDILKSKPKGTDAVSLAIADIVENDSRGMGTTVPGSLYQVGDLMRGESDSVLLPVARLDGEKQEDTEGTDGADPHCVVSGAAVLSQGTLRGYLDKDQTLWALLLSGEDTRGYVHKENPDGGISEAQILSSKRGKIRTDGDTVTVPLSLRIGVKTVPQAYVAGDPGALDEMEEQYAHAIESGAAQTILRVLGDMGCNPFGFEVPEGGRVEVSVTVRIDNTGRGQ